jgi:hypothetical protein
MWLTLITYQSGAEWQSDGQPRAALTFMMYCFPSDFWRTSTALPKAPLFTNRIFSYFSMSRETFGYKPTFQT